MLECFFKIFKDSYKRPEFGLLGFRVLGVGYVRYRRVKSL